MRGSIWPIIAIRGRKISACTDNPTTAAILSSSPLAWDAHTSMPHSRTWPATFLASGQSSGVPTALHRKASVSTRTQSAANGMRCNTPRTQDAGACLQETHCIVLPLIACNCSSRQSAQSLYRAVVPCATASLVACVRDAQSQSISGWMSIGSVLLFLPSEQFCSQADRGPLRRR